MFEFAFSGQAFAVSTGLVALAEVGDKTQLLAFMLAARYQRFWPVAWGILVATVLNHALAAWLGGWLAQTVGTEVLRWVLGLGFLGMAAWALVPDRADDLPQMQAALSAWQVFATTTALFFMAEMGDKTQVATAALAARYANWAAVVAGTTLGMLLANLPAVWLGERMAKRLTLQRIAWVHRAAAVVLGGVGLLTLMPSLFK